MIGRPGFSTPRLPLQAAIGALGVLVLAALSARLFRDRRVALATGVAASLHPGLVRLTTGISNDPLFLLLLLTSGFLVLAAADRPSSNLAVGSGVLLAAAGLTRPSALWLAPLLAAPLFDRRYPRRARAHLAASSLLGFLLVLVPWSLRNAPPFLDSPVISASAPAGSPHPDAFFGLPAIRWGAVLVEVSVALLAIAGLATAARPRIRDFALAYLFLTMAPLLLLRVPWRQGLESSDPVLLLYAVAGAARLPRGPAGSGERSSGK